MLKSIRRSHTKREAALLLKNGMTGSISVSRVEKLRKQLNKPALRALNAHLLAVTQDQVEDRINGLSIPHLTRLWEAVKKAGLALYRKHAEQAGAQQTAQHDATMTPETVVASSSSAG